MRSELVGEISEIPDATFKIVRIPLLDAKESAYQMDYVICNNKVGDVLADPEIKSRIAGITTISDKVFPPTRAGGSMHIGHKDLVVSSQRFSTITTGDTGEIIGFHFFSKNKLPDTQFSVLDIHAAGVDPAFQGRKLLEISREKLIQYEQPDIIYGSTIHPAIYKAYQAVGKRNEYVFFPTDANTPDWIVSFARCLLSLYSSWRSAITLDNMLVKREHLPMMVQEEVPYHGFGLFEQVLQVNPRDGVFMMLLKPKVVKWIEQKFAGRSGQLDRGENL